MTPTPTTAQQVSVAGAFIFDEHGRIFLGRYAKKFEQKWSIPGGKIEFGETPEEAVRREVKEETNIDLQATEFFICGSFIANGVHVVYIDFLADCPAGAAIKINDEFSAWGFFTGDELPHLPMHDETRVSVLAAMRQRTQRETAKTLQGFHLGLIRQTLNLVSYQPQWAEAYKWLCDDLATALGPTFTLHHVGSTSIIGLCAKPILDVLVLSPDAEGLRQVITRLEQRGFTYRGDAVARVNAAEPDPERHFLAFYGVEGNVDYAHVHAVTAKHPYAQRLLTFQAKMVEDERARQQYAELKEKLRQGGLSRAEFARAKTAFIDSVLI